MKNKNWKLKILVFGLVLIWVFGELPTIFNSQLFLRKAEAQNEFSFRSRIADGYNRGTKKTGIDGNIGNHDKTKLLIYATEVRPTDNTYKIPSIGGRMWWYYKKVGTTAWIGLNNVINDDGLDDILKLAGDNVGEDGNFNDGEVVTVAERVVPDAGECVDNVSFRESLHEHAMSFYLDASSEVTASYCTETQALIDFNSSSPGDEFEFRVKQSTPGGYINIGPFLSRVRIANNAPSIVGGSVIDSPDPVNPGQTLTFELDWTNGDGGGGEMTTAHFCKDDAVTPSSGGGSCAGAGPWADATAAVGTTGHAVATRDIGAGDGSGQQNYYAFVCDNNGTIPACSSSVSGTFTITAADTTIEPTTPNYWAWNDVIGWIDFCNPNQFGICQPIVDTAPPAMTRYANSSVGYIAFNCDNVDIGLSCTGNPQNDFKVNVEDTGSVSKLSGWAWNDVIGWISFCGSDSSGSIWNAGLGKWDCPPSGGLSFYQVEINNGTREFHGWAWNDVVGWVRFNCDETAAGGDNTCGTVPYRVMRRGTPQPQEGILTSSIFDTEGDGAMINSILWKAAPGNNVPGINVQIASSDNSNGPWNYYNPETGDGSYAYALANTPVVIKDLARHANKRYFRYRVQLVEVAGQSPLVDDVIINWSP